MKVSVIIPSFNGLEKLKIVLPSLSTQEMPPHEVIVILDGSTDGTREWLISCVHMRNLKVVTQSNKGRSGARNAGVFQATGDILIFVDDDMQLDSRFIGAHVSLQTQCKDSICGFAVSQDINTRKCTDFYRFRKYRENIWNKAIRDHGMKFGFGCTTQNLSISRAVFTQVGGFDETLKDSEDVDLGFRATLLGIPIVYICDGSGTVPLHCDYSDIEAYIKRQHEYRSARNYLIERKPHYQKLFDCSTHSNRGHGILRTIGYKFFHYNRLWRCVLKTFDFIPLLPMRIRFKIYDYIITASSVQKVTHK